MTDWHPRPLSEFWLNLHHVLYALAWSRRGPRLRSAAQALPEALSLPEIPIRWYGENVADHDLLFGEGMCELHWALARGDLAALDEQHRSILETAAPAYRDAYWAGHDATNEHWAQAKGRRVGELAGEIVPLLERWFDAPWPDDPIRVDVVWVGNWAGAYTELDPPHIIVSSTDQRHLGDAATEILFHEAAHLLVPGLRRRLGGDDDLWHAVLFHLVGEAVRRTLAGRGVDYVPYLIATGLLDRAWPQYRDLLGAVWTAYADGRVDLAEAIRRSRAR